MPWGGGNSGAWGPSPWGDGAAAPPIPPIAADAVVQAVTVLGTNLLRLDFNVAMKSDDILKDPTNYTVVPNGSGVTITPVRVQAPTGPSTSYVLLSITPFSVGEYYTVDIVNLRTTAGSNVDVANSSAEFYGKETKLDYARSLQQSLYNNDPDSILGTILIAIMGEDEKIGGGSNE